MQAENPSKIFFYLIFIGATIGLLFVGSLANKEPHPENSGHTTLKSVREQSQANHKETNKMAEVTSEAPNLKEQKHLKPTPKEEFTEEMKAKMASMTQKSDAPEKAVREEEPENAMASVTKPEETITEPEETQAVETEVSFVKSSSDYFAQLRKEYNETVLSKIESGDIRRDVIVRYYVHPPDGNKVYSLEELGFYIHERPVEGPLISYESNAVFYGDNVSESELKLVVYNLLKEGMPIKQIAKSQYHDGWKASSIEIGTDTTATSKSIITPDELQGMSF
ncbi:MAG: hypothetical protein ABJ004_19260 [Cyclobacteriaceae bacterium]